MVVLFRRVFLETCAWASSCRASVSRLSPGTVLPRDFGLRSQCRHSCVGGCGGELVELVSLPVASCRAWVNHCALPWYSWGWSEQNLLRSWKRAGLKHAVPVASVPLRIPAAASLSPAQVMMVIAEGGGRWAGSKCWAAAETCSELAVVAGVLGWQELSPWSYPWLLPSPASLVSRGWDDDRPWGLCQGLDEPCSSGR